MGSHPEICAHFHAGDRAGLRVLTRASGVGLEVDQSTHKLPQIEEYFPLFQSWLQQALEQLVNEKRFILLYDYQDEAVVDRTKDYQSIFLQK